MLTESPQVTPEKTDAPVVEKKSAKSSAIEIVSKSKPKKSANKLKEEKSNKEQKKQLVDNLTAIEKVLLGIILNCGRPIKHLLKETKE